MIIQGLQKLTLLDYPGKVACTIFTAGCNFRCPFCHNASLVIDTSANETIPEEEIFRFLTKRQGILDGVCISGGEPLIQDGIEEFIRQIKEMGYDVKLDTNGSFPDKLIRLVEAGLIDYVAMDIKNSQEHYGRTIGIEDYDIRDVHRSVKYLMSGKVPYEFRTTVVREFHQRSDFASIGRWIRGAREYYLQQFVDSGDLIRPGLHGYNKEIMEQALEVVKKDVESAKLRGL
ncbi:anaerobic ribonucleoside-triphosphate reductase activating protein [Claveliimonas bilis]|uniref:Anaerobic ribonucleoside-triphosphate reductase activating protein n=1 Tax=Claveliimonas bilis TaxID=3028070 RepID=A0ABM8I4G2_9FIRM|nr:anaerobic ribonucleoside-triphosphate reductase activating protein [Claveliimonas bilis]MCQ5202899.1 anaerobic ribonucleoside-triphosphate reductase activating protein [Mordavella massiliensis]HIZ59985.1 anaerobic ribonucleoside-triphosphate reductase activating protein [Candidatus Dorea faecipullorum]BCZ26749.1 anaerobic ribonucleoside-triphosphate reductase activating protein [Claveliimonas bilis]BDZ76632.1 anaerobic ribonucleoside-triphosphate reductase activating protein [Claveliimonas b